MAVACTGMTQATGQWHPGMLLFFAGCECSAWQHGMRQACAATICMAGAAVVGAKGVRTIETATSVHATTLTNST